MMTTIIKDLVFIIVYVTGLAYGSSYGLKYVYSKVKVMALEKVAQGLPSMTSISQNLTCWKYDNDMKEVKVMTGHCGRHWRKQALKNLR